MDYLSVADVLEIHEAVIARSGGGPGLRDIGLVESAVAQQHASFAEKDLYPDLVDKATALCFSLVSNHPFVDGNKRVGHTSLLLLLNLNGYTIRPGIDEAEKIFLALAAGELGREELTQWVTNHIQAVSE